MADVSFKKPRAITPSSKTKPKAPHSLDPADIAVERERARSSPYAHHFKAESKSKLPFGSSLNRASDDNTNAYHRWLQVDATTFNVRKGPNYKSTRTKANSGPALYEVFAVDAFFSDRKVPDLDQHIQYPTFADYARDLCAADDNDVAQMTPADERVLWAADAKTASDDDDDEDSVVYAPDANSSSSSTSSSPSSQGLDAFKAKYGVPPFFVINAMWPAYAPPNILWGGKKEDGPNYSLVLYCRLSKAGKDALVNGTPAGKLLKRFINGLNDEDLTNRMKCIPRVAPYSKTQLPYLLSQYNSTPFLTRPQHSFKKTDLYVECVVDVHIFSYVVRKGFQTFLPWVKDMVVDYAFVIQGEDDSELPEAILAAVRLSRWDSARATYVKT